jgi:hypothetical protein
VTKQEYPISGSKVAAEYLSSFERIVVRRVPWRRGIGCKSIRHRII